LVSPLGVDVLDNRERYRCPGRLVRFLMIGLPRTVCVFTKTFLTRNFVKLRRLMLLALRLLAICVFN
jgi:hypothetical protein